MGTETIKVFVIPRVRMISDRLDSPEVTQNNVDRISGNQIKHLLCVIILITSIYICLLISFYILENINSSVENNTSATR